MEFSSPVPLGYRPGRNGAIESKSAFRPAILRGYGTRYNKVHPSSDPDFGADVFERGVFDWYLENGWGTEFLTMHDNKKVFGTTKDGSLKLYDDARGLAFELTQKSENPAFDALVADVKSGVFPQMSVGFRPIKSRTEVVDGVRVRFIEEALLGEISAVTYPAVPNTFIFVTDETKSLGDMSAAARDGEIERDGAAALVSAHLNRLLRCLGNSSKGTPA